MFLRSSKIYQTLKVSIKKAQAAFSLQLDSIFQFSVKLGDYMTKFWPMEHRNDGDEECG